MDSFPKELNQNSVRLDKALVAWGLAGSRERARTLIKSGKVVVRGLVVTRSSFRVVEEAEVTLLEPDIPFVGRGGIKLSRVLETLDVDFSEKVVLDVGASTGGFTECLLGFGAARVYAIDVGHGQLAESLRRDPRVINMEGVNARYLQPADLPEAGDAAVVDVSFVSLTKILPSLRALLKPGAFAAVLVKPQFEVGRRSIGKSGIVKDAEARKSAVERVSAVAREEGFRILDQVQSPIPGAKGNREVFLILMRVDGKDGSGNVVMAPESHDEPAENCAEAKFAPSSQ